MDLKSFESQVKVMDNSRKTQIRNEDIDGVRYCIKSGNYKVYFRTFDADGIWEKYMKREDFNH